MAVFSKLTSGRGSLAGERLLRLLKDPANRQPLLIFIAAVLIIRSSVIPSSKKRKAKESGIALPVLSEEELAGHARHFPLLPESAPAEPSAPGSPKPTLSLSFIHQLKSLLRIVIPSLTSREALILLAHSAFLVSRTVLSVAVARLDGRIVRDLVSADKWGFLKGLGWWFLLAVPSIYTNSMIRHLQSTLALRFRTRLTRYIHSLYLSSAPHLRYYRVPLQGVDQYLTADVEAWSESVAGIYGNLLKPSLDLLLFTSQLARSLGFKGTVLLFVNYYVTVKILRAVTPAFGRLASVEARLEGEYRAGVNRVGRESEEVAFYDGGPLERTILLRAYTRLIRHVNNIYKIRIAYEWTEDFVVKYLWSAAGYGVVGVGLLARGDKVGGDFFAKGGKEGEKNRVVADRTETYISNRRLLLSLADAGGRLMYAYKDLVEVAGLTGRLYTLLSTLHNLPSLPTPLPGDGNTFELRDVDVCIPTRTLLLGSAESKGHTTLVRALSLSLHRGTHLMITGSNGVGKTAVARVLAGLWAAGGGGAVVKPGAGDGEGEGRERMGVFVVPQRAYMVSGSVLEQVIYPLTLGEFYARAEGGLDEALGELQGILEAAHLGYLVEREGGWGTVKEWRDVLSGGEKQRMALARVFYHRPKFAILDECTSAVSSDVEGQMYEHAKSLGISLITISLRPSLTKYHTHLLTLTGDGTGSWTETGEQGGSGAHDLTRVLEEIRVLEMRLEESKKWEGRVRELEGALSVRS
ncbi:hypothetical protein HYDPIDRAFT_103628 [Hydnomerulius pinastri MD-312]|uniref:ABC transporter domain-containing protein n=1 Tax=Hydnomerulius pinastri MD-312 TaxID=994086 RepID=A0A0C9W6Q2_9AGAM|nr:hypothetical protein HYDPIDRAFT_103628 [Hydnomerulius pinastri MD-312]